MSTIKDKNLSAVGQQEVDWAARQMKVLEEIKTEFSSNKPLNGLNIGACMHVTKETANLMLTLKAAGANVALCASSHYQLKIQSLPILLRMMLKYMQYMEFQMMNSLSILILFQTQNLT